MNGQGDTQSIAAVSTLAEDGGVVSANRLANTIKRRWRGGESPDVAVALAEHPDLHRYRSVVLDLACQEYQHRLSTGESLDPEEFSRRFPCLQKSLYMLLEVQRLLEHDPQFRIEPKEAPWPEPGEDYLGFCLLAELGRGTYGRVFLASQPALGDRLVALKVAPHGGEEAEIIGKLRHPNVVPIYSIEEDPETGWTAVCMPYLGRTTLCDVLDLAFIDGRCPARADVILDAIQDLGDASDLRETQQVNRILTRGTYVDGVLHLAAQLADALAYTHSRGICHRDLKPSNVLLTLEGRPLLLDFNLSFDGQRTAKRIGGTLPYMAPEQLRALIPHASQESEHPDPRSDIFALGVILYELLCGRHPFGDVAWNQPLDLVAASLLERQKQGAASLEQHNRQVDRSLARLIRRCLAFDPADRPQSAAELAVALRRELSPLPRVRRWSQRHPLWTACLGVFFVGILLGIMAGVALRDSASVRYFKSAKEAFDQEKYASAMESLNTVIGLDANSVEARVFLARTYQQLEMWDKAADVLKAADRIAPSGKLAAAIGYSIMKSRNNLMSSEPYHEKAIHRGYRSADVLTNLAFCYQNRAKWQDAEKLLKEAVAKDPDLRAARFDLVMTYYNAAGQLSSNHYVLGERIQPMYIPQEAYAHARKLVEMGTPSAHAYLVAGQFMFQAEETASRFEAIKAMDLSARPEASERRLGMEYLKQAILHGIEPRMIPALERHAKSAPLPERKEWQALLDMPAVRTKVVRCETTVNPLEYSPPSAVATVPPAPLAASPLQACLAD